MNSVAASTNRQNPAFASEKLTVRLRRPLLAHPIFAAGLLGGLGFLDHYSFLPYRDFALLCVMGLFSWLALSKRFDSRWALLVLLPALGLLSFTMLYGYVFTLRVDAAPLIPSVLSQRRYAFLLLGPIMYMLYLRGWRMTDFQRIFVVSVVLVLANQIVYDVFIAPQSLLLSGEFFVLYLGEATEEATATRAAGISAIFSVFYFGRRVFQTSDVPALLFNLSVLAFSVVFLAITVPRGLLTAVGAALVVYFLWLARPDRARLGALMIPLYAALAALLWIPLREYFNNTFGDDRTWKAREDTSQQAWEMFREYPLLGFGSDSVQSISYQDLFGDGFYTADIGLLGVAFQYGVIGVILYVVLVGWLFVRLLGMKWSMDDKASPEQNAFVWALLMVCIVFVFTSPLQAQFVYFLGTPIGAFAWGLLMVRGGADTETEADRPEHEEPVAASEIIGTRAR